MTADVPTLLLMIIVSSVVVSGALLVLNGSQRNDGLQYWAGGLLLSAMAHALLLLYGRIPNVFSVVLGNALLSAALAGFLLAVRRFHGLALHRGRMLALIASVAGLMLVFQNQFASRVVASGLILGFQAGLVLQVLLRHHACQQDNVSRGALLLASGLGSILATMLLRSSAALFFSIEIASILQGNLVQTLTFMVSFLSVLVSSFGFVFMAKERADNANMRLASQDALTGVANRRALMQALERELARAARQRTPLALLMLDIDHFKRVNDQYGHLAGDQVLRHMVSVVRQRL
ncbi:MAG: diguanylate cyclase, partial [Burkholderiaceae bacterium]|nr:diguanylate cyclase [Burkholderiaceae bacterium]